MKWGDLKNEVLGLMFSNVSGGKQVLSSDAQVQEYVLNMPDAAQYAFADLSTVCPHVEELTIELPLDVPVIDLKERCPLFIRILENECTHEEPRGSYSKFTGFSLMGNNKLLITDNTSGTVHIFVACYPLYPDESTPEDTEINYPREAVTAAAYYMAHRLFAEDDISLSIQYLNMYENMKEGLRETYMRDLYGFDEYSNKAGWL